MSVKPYLVPGSDGAGTDDWTMVLTQGTSVVSLFAVQSAKAGARVITTTSCPEGKDTERLGSYHIINYRKAVSWDTKARELTADEGVDLVMEVAEPSTLQQSVESFKLDGIINVVGSVGDEGEECPPCWIHG